MEWTVEQHRIVVLLKEFDAMWDAIAAIHRRRLMSYTLDAETFDRKSMINHPEYHVQLGTD